MINKNTLKLMKPGSFLINIARGGLINTADLIEALERHQIAGAALDTFEDETVINQDLSGQTLRDPQLSKLIPMDQVILTPHIGFYTTLQLKTWSKAV
jgi:Lactate dehydrogenase and related dehydrogenases